MKLITDFVLIIGIILSLFVLIGHIRIKKREVPQKILIVFWIFIVAIIIHFYGVLHSLSFVYLPTLLFVNISQLLLPVLIYLYLKSIFLKRSDFFKSNLLHFIPVIGYFIIYTLPNIINRLTALNIFSHLEIIDQYINHALLKDSLGIFYFFLSSKLFFRIQNTMKHHYSDMNDKDFFWLSKFLLSFFGVIIIDFILTLNEIYFQYNTNWDAFITVTFLIISMAYLGYFGPSQSTISLPKFLIDEYPINHKKIVPVQKDAEILKSKLEAIIRNDKPYLIPDLTLRMLAEKMNISERNLSRLLNETMQVSFYDLINKYRVQEVKERLKSKEYEKYSITGIGISSGFSSKSSFYRVFKKETGLSPSNYQKTI